VTGGAGFVGTNLVKRLVQMGHEVRVIDDFSTGLRSNLQNEECQVLEVSISDEVEVSKALQGVDWIFHLAARGSVPRSIKSPGATFQVNTIGTLNVVNTARDNDCPIVFSSSSSVYGRNIELPKSESSWVAPLTPYAASKLSGEALVQSYSDSYGFPALIFRFFNIFGQWQRPDHDYAAVIPKWIWGCMNKQRLQVFGDGEQSRDFTHVDTVIDLLVETLNKDIFYKTPVNLAYGNRISLNELLAELQNYFPSFEYEYLSARKGDVKASQNDPRLLRELFPSITPIEFGIGLKKTIDWLQVSGSQVAGQAVDQN